MRVSYFVFLFCALSVCASHAGGFLQGVVPFPTPAPPTYTQSSGDGWLKSSSFPTVFDDLSFSERRTAKAKGYEPFKDMEAYRGLVVEGEEHFIERQLALLEMEREGDEQTLSHEEYCAKYPLDDSQCGTSSTTQSTTTDPVTTTPSRPSDSSVVGGPTGITPPSPAPTTSGGGSYSGRTIGGGRVVVSNKTHSGSCYPAAKSSHFKNQILTSGQYETVSPAFEKALITVFRKEGGCGTIKNDPCGYTCYGLGSGPKCMNMDVSKLTRKDAETVYYDRFWNKYNFGKLPDVIAGDVFLASMGSGTCTAIQQFRQFLGLSKNCKIDDAVVAAAENYQGDIHNKWLDVRKQFLTEVAARRYANKVLKGWMNSIQLKRENGCHVVPSDPLYRN